MSNVKHFSQTEHGDIKVTLGRDEDQLPEVRFHFGVEEIGEASVAIGFQSDQVDVASSMFEHLDEEGAVKAVQVGKEQVRQLAGDIRHAGSWDDLDDTIR